MTTGKLAGRIAIVTGGGKNIGRAVARAFAREGAKVVVASRNRENLTATVEMIRDDGGEAMAVPTDVTELVQVEALVATTLGSFGTVDCFAAIAGGGCTYESIEDLHPDDWDRIYKLNATSTFYSARAVFPVFLRKGRGTLITCSGGGSYYPALGPKMAAYACAKAAVCRFTDQITAEYWEAPIRVNCLDPGLVWDDETLARVEMEEKKSGRIHPQRAMNRPPEVAAELAVWLASECSEPLRGRLISVYDEWWRDSAAVKRVHENMSRYRLWRDDR